MKSIFDKRYRAIAHWGLCEFFIPNDPDKRIYLNTHGTLLSLYIANTNIFSIALRYSYWSKR